MIHPLAEDEPRTTKPRVRHTLGQTPVPDPENPDSPGTFDESRLTDEILEMYIEDAHRQVERRIVPYLGPLTARETELRRGDLEEVERYLAAHYAAGTLAGTTGDGRILESKEAADVSLSWDTDGATAGISDDYESPLWRQAVRADPTGYLPYRVKRPTIVTPDDAEGRSSNQVRRSFSSSLFRR